MINKLTSKHSKTNILQTFYVSIQNMGAVPNSCFLSTLVEVCLFLPCCWFILYGDSNRGHNAAPYFFGACGLKAHIPSLKESAFSFLFLNGLKLIHHFI